MLKRIHFIVAVILLFCSAACGGGGGGGGGGKNDWAGVWDGFADLLINDCNLDLPTSTALKRQPARY